MIRRIAGRKRKVTAAQKHKIMTKLLSTTGGRRKIAANMQEPLRQLRDYVSIGRKAFFVDELPDGSLPVYDTDVETPSYVVGEEGDSIQEVVKASRITVPLFELASLQTIPFTQVKERRFDIVRRIKQKSKDELFRNEDQKIFDIFDQAGINNDINVPIEVTDDQAGMDTIIEGMANIESTGHRVDKIFMNPFEYKIFRNAGRDYVDFETQKELLKTGLMGSVWGTSLMQSIEVPKGKMFLVTEPEYLGVMPIRLDLTVLPADDAKTRTFGWSLFTQLGICLHNPKYGLQMISVNYD